MKIATAFSGGFGSVEFALKYMDQPHEVVFAAEWMDKQRESYLLNHGEPTSNFYKDIRDLDGTKYKGEIDYYHLSPPCQSYSLAGSRGGADDERGGLMFEAIKSIDEVQPKMFSIENVRGLLSSNNGEDWKNILKDVQSLKGYTISWGIMNAKEQGTPQNRERVFIVGFRGQAPQMSFPARVKLDKVLRDVLDNDVEEKYFLSEKAVSNFIRKNDDPNNGMKIQAFHSKDDEVCATITARYHKCGITDPYIREELVQVGNIDQQGHNSLWGRVYDIDGIAPNQNAKGGGAGAKTGLFLVPSGHKKGYVEVGHGDSINLAFANNPNSRSTARTDGILNTLDTSCNQAVVLERIRRLTPRECARVQGDFQDMFQFGKASDTKLYEFIGNAMDISTTKNLISQMQKHLSTIELNEASEPSFTISNTEKNSSSLFDLGIA